MILHRFASIGRLGRTGLGVWVRAALAFSSDRHCQGLDMHVFCQIHTSERVCQGTKVGAESCLRRTIMRLTRSQGILRRFGEAAETKRCAPVYESGKKCADLGFERALGPRSDWGGVPNRGASRVFDGVGATCGPEAFSRQSPVDFGIRMRETLRQRFAVYNASTENSEITRSIT